MNTDVKDPSVPYKSLLIKIVGLAALSSGLLNLYSLFNPGFPERIKLLKSAFPMEFIHLARFVTLSIGFALIISAINILKRKRRAWTTVLFLSAFSVVFHLFKGLNYEEALVSAGVVGILLYVRKQFTVKSSIPSLKWGLIRLATAVIVAFAYGVAGFWFLDTVHFRIDFRLVDSIRETFLYLILIGDPDLVPRTTYAAWFLNSLYLITIMAIIYSLFAVFRPVLYIYRTHPHELHLAREIVENHGRSSLDFFKYYPDKSFFFSGTRTSFIAYRVANHCAVTLGDPVGPADEITVILREFMALCAENDWIVGFYQTLPDFLACYSRLGFKKLKVGDDVIVSLEEFNLEGHKVKQLRHALHRAEQAGISLIEHQPPLPDHILERIKTVSDEWLRIPGRRERQFTVGNFDLNYLRSMILYTVQDAAGKILAFTNLVPSYRPDEATIDLMRRSNEAPWGLMDFLFIRLFVELKMKGYKRFNLGLAPLSGLIEEEESSFEEKAIHYFFQYLNFLFSFEGLERYKSKFASTREPRYLMYQKARDLPRLAIALRKVSEIKAIR
jgi:phosphatidylglycerol lysyltransferase